jgi:hypothetical protein
MTDHIIAEIRSIRTAIAEENDCDLDAIVHMLQEAERRRIAAGRAVVPDTTKVESPPHILVGTEPRPLAA